MKTWKEYLTENQDTNKPNSTFKLYGKVYNTIVFNSDKDANAFMKKNSEWGVIGTEKNKVYLAKITDMGK